MKSSYNPSSGPRRWFEAEKRGSGFALEVVTRSGRAKWSRALGSRRLRSRGFRRPLRSSKGSHAARALCQGRVARGDSLTPLSFTDWVNGSGIGVCAQLPLL